MQLAEAYIAIDRRLAMARGHDLRDRTQGAALFADISGFTPLTEAMASELGAKRGAEEVTKQLNSVYGAVIADVDQYHGSVIGFSGDAITCWFDADDGARAITCGFAIQQTMRQFATIHTPGGKSISLAIKVAVASGPVRRMCVGDPGIQLIDVLAGATMDRLADAEHHANKSEIVVSAEIVSALGGRLGIAEWRGIENGDAGFAAVADLSPAAPADPWVTDRTKALCEEQVRPWVLASIYERLTSGQGQFLAELRPATALFMRFGGIDYDGDEDACARLDAFVHYAQGVVAHHEGILVQLTIGDKGAYLYAAFGAPLAHDDDPDRALATALELLDLPPELGYINGLQMGVTRGRMRAGPYGAAARCTYGVMGDAVNLAARLMTKAAPRQILVDERIASAVADRFDLDFIGPMNVKGKKIPVQVSCVTGHRTSARQRHADAAQTVLIGREAELTQMAHIVEAHASGRGQVLRLQGPAGSGKSRLARALIEMVEARGSRVLLGYCQGVTEGAAYESWRQVFARLFELGDEAGAENQDRRIAFQVEEVVRTIERMNRDWLLRLPLLGDLLGLPIPDNPTTAAFEPRLRQSALFELLIEIAQMASVSQPLVILIDDVHLMDEASLSLTAAFGRVAPSMQLLLVLVHRSPSPASAILPQLDQLPGHQRVNLGDLSPQSIQKLVTARLGGRTSALALSLIQVETQGNPFFTLELVDALRESGNLVSKLAADGESTEWALSQHIFDALQRADCLEQVRGEWMVTADAHLGEADLGLPDSIQGIVLARIDHLPEAPKLTLKVASVVGATFALNVVALAHPLHPDESTLVMQAELLEARDFTRLVSQQHRAYAFTYRLTHDVAYETLLFDQRRQLHRSVSEALERYTPDAIAPLAYHSFLGEDWQKAMHYQLAAGLQAKKLFANRDGIEHLRRALQCAAALPPEDTLWQRQQIHSVLGELLAVIGQYEPALEHLHQALGLAETEQNSDAQADACRWIAYVHELRSEYTLALEWIQHGLQALGARETASRAELLAIAGLIYTRLGQYDRALEQCEVCIRIATQANAMTSLAFAHHSRAIVHYRHGDNAATIEDSKQALMIYEQTENIQGQALSCNEIGNAYQSMGQWSEAIRYFRRARDIFIQTGDELHLIFASNNLGETARHQGRLDEALNYYQGALRTVEKIGGSVYVIAVLHMNLGATWAQRGEISAAREHLYTSLEKFAAIQSRDFLSELHRHLASAALAAGELGEALNQGQQSLALAQELNMRSEEGIALRVLGDITLAMRDFSLAEHTLSQSVSILADVDHEYELARSRLSLAKAYIALSKTEPGLDVLQQCTRVFQRLDAVSDLETASILRERAEHEREENDCPSATR